MKMKEIVLRIIAFFFLLAIVLLAIFGILEMLEQEQVQASSGNSGNTSDIQLLARAINRRSKRRAL